MAMSKGKTIVSWVLQVLRPIIFIVPLAVIVMLRRPWPFASTHSE